MTRAARPGVVAALVLGAALVGAGLVGCVAPAELPVDTGTTAESPASQSPAAAPAPPRGTIAAPVADPEAPVATAHYTPSRTADPSPPASRPPTPSAAPTASAAPTPSAAPSQSSTPAPVTVAALLRRAEGLSPLTWNDSTGASHTAPWLEVAGPGELAPAAALPHVAAARSAGGDCAAVAAAGDGAAIEAAAISLAVETMPGSPVDLVLVRYPSAAAAASAVEGLQTIGVACEGVETAEGTLGSGVPLLSATVVLESGGKSLVADATSVGVLLVGVVHEGAPPEAVTALVAAQRAALS
ncbi:hypothetical protein [Agrococcus sp. DT81.2]|uniref:hypothetical protein n=1 Tax=Agrococcus sp. DT81.2 TaxID=3393414 RepID=UPI003CE46452